MHIFVLLSLCTLETLNIQFLFSALQPMSIPVGLQKDQDSSDCGQYQGVEVSAGLCSRQCEREAQTKLPLGKCINWAFTGELVTSIERSYT